MSRRAPRSVVVGHACAALVLLASTMACRDAVRPRPPAVVVIVLDALHAGHLSHLGYERPTTPQIDALAADGVTFTSAFAPAPYTLASVPSLMTGRLPDTHGVTTKDDRLRDDETTLAEVMRAAGYRTLAVVSSSNGGARTGIHQGFDEFVELYRVEAGRSADIERPSGSPLHIPRADEVPPVVERWLGHRADGRPLFLYVHMLQPHAPYDPPAAYRDLFLDPDYDGPMTAGDTRTLAATSSPADRDKEAARALYDANLRWADDNVGRILDALHAAGLYHDALIVVTSDHGEAFWQHGLWGHSAQLYDEMLRIPLVVKLPDDAGPRGAHLSGLASLVDVLPSLCDLLRLPAPPGLDGLSLADAVALSEDAPAHRELLLRTHHTFPHVALRTPTHKTIVVRERATGSTERVEQYRLVEDPAELVDVAPLHGGTLTPVVERLQEWIDGAGVRQAASAPPLTPEESELLEALGYLGDS